MVTGKNMRNEIASDGNRVFGMSQFINIVTGRDINDKYGLNMVGKLLKEDSIDKPFLENFGIYKIRNARGSYTHAMTFDGLKGLLCTNALKGVALAQKYIHYAAETTTRIEAGDPLMKKVIDANAVSSNIYNAMARDALAQEASSAGPSIATPTDQVLAAHAWCVFAVFDLTTESFLCLFHRTQGCRTWCVPSASLSKTRTCSSYSRKLRSRRGILS
jgi:hypothetical protein